MSAAGRSPALVNLPLTSSLTSVLTRLGHPCERQCVAEDPALGDVWFSRHRTSGGAALVVVDVSHDADPLTLHHLLHELNECTRTHGIRVLPRREDDRGRALARVVRVPA